MRTDPWPAAAEVAVATTEAGLPAAKPPPGNNAGKVRGAVVPHPAAPPTTTARAASVLGLIARKLVRSHQRTAGAGGGRAGSRPGSGRAHLVGPGRPVPVALGARARRIGVPARRRAGLGGEDATAGEGRGHRIGGGRRRRHRAALGGSLGLL